MERRRLAGLPDEPLAPVARHGDGLRPGQVRGGRVWLRVCASVPTLSPGWKTYSVGASRSLALPAATTAMLAPEGDTARSSGTVAQVGLEAARARVIPGELPRAC